MTFLLSEKYPLETLKTLLIPLADWHPYPTVHERDAWEALPATVRAAYIAEGEAWRLTDWPQLLAVRYLDFARDGNRSRYSERLFRTAAKSGRPHIAECMEAQGRFLDEILNGIWLICEESSLVRPRPHRTAARRIGLAGHHRTHCRSLCRRDFRDARLDALPARRQTGHHLAAASGPACTAKSTRASSRPCWSAKTSGGWASMDIVSTTGTRGSTPTGSPARCWWNRMPTAAPRWSPNRCPASTSFTGPYPKDGGCDEGPGYWGRAGASLLDCLELLYSATDGQVNVYDEPLIQEIGRFIYRVHIADD